MTERPTTLMIGGYRYAVEDGRELIQTDGEHRRASGRIMLDPSRVSTHDSVCEVLVHEIVHAIRANGGHGIDLGTAEEIRAAKDAEERFISSIEWGVVEVLRANPALVAFLVATE